MAKPSPLVTIDWGYTPMHHLIYQVIDPSYGGMHHPKGQSLSNASS